MAPAHFPTPPPCAWTRGYLDELTGPVAESGTGRRNNTPIPQLGAYAKGTEVACGCSHRVVPHAERITHGRSGIPWAKEWPSIGIICRSVIIQTLGLRSPIPLVAALPLYRDAVRIADPDPDRNDKCRRQPSNASLVGARDPRASSRCLLTDFPSPTSLVDCRAVRRIENSWGAYAAGSNGERSSQNPPRLERRLGLIRSGSPLRSASPTSSRRSSALGSLLSPMVLPCSGPPQAYLPAS